MSPIRAAGASQRLLYTVESMPRGLASVPLILALVACTGEDPAFVPTTSPGTSADGGNDATGERSLSPLLDLEGQSLVLVAGTNDVLQIKVRQRRDLGEVTFDVKGLPEGVSAPGVVTLGVDAAAINIPVSSVPSAIHGDFVVSLEAQGKPFQATAKLSVRGTPGSPDTGFGAGGTALVQADVGDQQVAVLSDERIVFGTSSGGKPSLKIVDAKGSTTPAINVTQTGALRQIVPTVDGGFVILVATGSDLRMVWFSKQGVETQPSLVVSTNTTSIARLAPTPTGTLFAQAKTGTAVTIERYGTGAADATFTPVSIPSGEGVAALRFLSGTAGGAAWIGMRVATSQEQIAHVARGEPVTAKQLAFTESCDHGTSFGNDVVAHCLNDVPSSTLRRYKPDGTLESSFGVGGQVAIVATNLDSIVAYSTNRLYVTRQLGSEKRRRVTAYDDKGAVRTVFGTEGTLDVTGADDVPAIAVDPRGRLVFVSSEHTTQANVRVRRYWE